MEEMLTIHTVQPDKRIGKTTQSIGLEARSYASLMASELGVTLVDATIYDTMTISQINKAIATLAKEQSAARKSSMTQAQISNLALQGRSRIEELRRQCQSRVEQCRQELMSASNSMVNKASQLAQETRTLYALEVNGGVDLAEQVRQVISDGWYELIDATHNSIEFMTAPVMLRYIHPEANIDKTLPMGRYKVVVKPMLGNLQVTDGEDNIKTSDGYIHPHVSGGTVCWGNAHAAFGEISSSFNIVLAMTALRSLLQTYNYDSPYKRFNKFEEAVINKEMLKGKLGNMYVANAKNDCLFKLRMSYTGNVQIIRNCAELYTAGRRWYVRGTAEDDQRSVLLTDGSHHSTTTLNDPRHVVVVDTLMFGDQDCIQFLKDCGFDNAHKIDMDKLRELSDEDIHNVINQWAAYNEQLWSK